MDFVQDRDLNVLRLAQWEGIMRRGTRAKLYSLDSEQDLFQDTEHVYLAPVNIHVVPEDMTKIRSFELSVWFPDEDEAIPMVASIPCFTDEKDPLEVKEGDVVEFPYKMAVGGGEQFKRFKVFKIMQHGQKAYFYKVNLVPDRPDSVPEIDREGTSNIFVDFGENE